MRYGRSALYLLAVLALTLGLSLYVLPYFLETMGVQLFMFTFFVLGVFIWFSSTHLTNRLMRQKTSLTIAAKENFIRTLLGWAILLAAALTIVLAAVKFA